MLIALLELATNLPTISCALVTRNRPESLARTLRSLNSQEPAPFEVIVSDDSDDDYLPENRRVVESFGYTYVSGPKNGVYANHNFAVRQCSGDHIRIVDDDHEFPEGHFRACYDAVIRDPLSVWFIGERYPGRHGELTNPGCPGQLNIFGVSEKPKDPQNCWAISGGATIYPRTIFDKGHAFVDEFKFGAAYLEFGSYLYHNGFHMRHLSDTYVVHHLDLNNRSFMDPEMQFSSRIFSMVCHSFLYQPRLKDQILTLAKCVQYIFQLRQPFRSLGKVRRAVARRRKELNLLGSNIA